jgi:ribonucleoside-diphosphate reductase alpha chain
MSLSTSIIPGVPTPSFPIPAAANEQGPVAFRVIRRDGSVSAFDPTKIAVAMTKAFLAVEGRSAAASSRVHETVEHLTSEVVAALTRRGDGDRIVHIEDVQDQVELALMRSEHPKVARAYVLYREEHARIRQAQAVVATPTVPAVNVRHADGVLRPLDEARLWLVVEEAAAGLDGVSADAILAETRRNLYDGLTLAELADAPVMAARTMIETELRAGLRPAAARQAAHRGFVLRPRRPAHRDAGGDD